jgi:esterase
MRDSLPVMEQTMVRVRGRMLSWVDFGGVGPTVLVLHGSFGRGAVFAPVADRLQGAARVVALDQRGHGLSDHGGPYTRAEFVADAAAVIHRLGSDPVVVLGHSLGGITAYQLAARHPELVRALIVEDVGAVMRQPGVPTPCSTSVAGPTPRPRGKRWLRRSAPKEFLTSITSYAALSPVSGVGGCSSTTTG